MSYPSSQSIDAVSATSSVVILASGGGSNARAILSHVEHNPKIKVVGVLTNRADAGVLSHAAAYQIPSIVFNKQTWQDETAFLKQLEQLGATHIVLAGFLWLVPVWLVRRFEGRIYNIHPALLPKFGGKGMYGHHVHEAVRTAKERFSGCTIHLVNEQYDRGEVLFQAACDLLPTDDATAIGAKVLALEHAHYARVLEAHILGNPIIFS
jgi:phosphoribosylglycinamide formyltransferase 1